MSALLNDVFALLSKDFVPILSAGVGPGVASIIGVFVGIFVLYFFMFVGGFVAALFESEELMIVGILGGTSLGMVLFIGGLTVMLAPMRASLERAIWAYLVKGEPLTVGAAFSTATQDIGTAILFEGLTLTAMLIGLMFCYVPGILLAVAITFARPAVFVHGLSIGRALSLSISHFQQHLGWHFGVWGLCFVAQLVLSNVPLVGAMLLSSVVPLIVLVAYRNAYGDDGPAAE